MPNDLSQLDLSVSRFLDYGEKFQTKSSVSIPYSATIDQFDPTEGDETFDFSSPSWRIDSKGIQETIRSNYHQSDMHEKIEMMVEE